MLDLRLRIESGVAGLLTDKTDASSSKEGIESHEVDLEEYMWSYSSSSADPRSMSSEAQL